MTRAGILLTALFGTIWTAPARAQTDMMMPMDRLATAREKLTQILAGSNGALDRITETLAQTSPTGAAGWHGEIALWSVAALAAGFFAARRADRSVRTRLTYLFNPAPETRYDKLAYLLLRALLQTLMLVLMLVVAGGIVMTVNGGNHEARVAHSLHLGGVGAVMLLAILSRNLLAPDVPSHRLFPLRDSFAIGLHRGFVTAFGIATAIYFTCVWMALLGLDENAHYLILVFGLAAIAIVFVGMILSVRDGLRALIACELPDEELPIWRRFLAGNAALLLALYFGAALFVAEVRILSNQPIPFSPVLVPMLLPIGGGFLYMLLLLIIDAVAGSSARRRAAKVRPDILDGGSDMTPAGPGHERVYTGASLKGVAERAAGLMVLASMAYYLLRVWSLSPEAIGYLWRFFDILAVAFVGYVAYQAIRAVIDRKIWEEMGDEEPVGELGDEGGAQSASRLATLLPLARNFLLITVFVMTVMIVASQLGVNIAPLFAGAGVVGLAIGFGAQTLIADIFSGAFFLIDDAFRKGDYVETGGVKGTVEKISVRSMQLRHHMGPLHTIPFSQIAHLTNYSRDWAMMKLKLRLTYDTDVEKVRKMIKNLGKDLLNDPEIGEKFVQPLKSQGVYAMEDSAMIIRVKFMTRPGDQFVVRKKVYAEIRRLFEQNGIRFAHREVTVRLAQDASAAPLTREQQEEIAGAVLPVIDEPTLDQKPADDGR